MTKIMRLQTVCIVAAVICAVLLAGVVGGNETGSITDWQMIKIAIPVGAAMIAFAAVINWCESVRERQMIEKAKRKKSQR